MSDEPEEAGPEAHEASEGELASLSALLFEWAGEDDAAAYDRLEEGARPSRPA